MITSMITCTIHHPTRPIFEFFFEPSINKNTYSEDNRHLDPSKNSVFVLFPLYHFIPTHYRDKTPSYIQILLLPEQKHNTQSILEIFGSF